MAGLIGQFFLFNGQGKIAFKIRYHPPHPYCCSTNKNIVENQQRGCCFLKAIAIKAAFDGINVYKTLKLAS